MNANHPRLLFLVVLAVLSLAASACGSAGDAGVATVGAATLSQEDLEAILEADGVEDTSVVSSELASRHISEWIYFESWIDLATAGGTELSAVHLDLARIEQEEARTQDPTVPAVDTPYGHITQRYRAVPHLIADHIISIAEVTEHLELAPEQITSFVFRNYEAELQQLQAGLYDRDISVDPRFGVFDARSGAVVSGAAQIPAGSLDATAS